MQLSENVKMANIKSEQWAWADARINQMATWVELDITALTELWIVGIIIDTTEEYAQNGPWQDVLFCEPEQWSCVP